jgi:hypothetical protein
MPRNWTAKLYAAHYKLKLWQYMPFMDLSEASAAIRAIQASDYWRGLIPNAPLVFHVEKAKTWTETGGVSKEGIRKKPGKAEYVITYPMGCAAFGFTVHELPHAEGPWRNGHDDRYMRVWLGLWRDRSPKVYFDVILEELRSRGVPVEEFV